MAAPALGGTTCRSRQSGQGMVEFVAAAIPVLLLGLGSIEAIHWYFVRQAVSAALVEAARHAIAEHAHPDVLDQAFTQALLPLHAAPTRAEGLSRIERGMARREHATRLPAWHIRIRSPAHATFRDFAAQDKQLPHRRVHRVIDNDYLQEQHEARLAQGWHQGQGPSSGQTTLDANTLVLHLTWLHEPLLPGIKQLLKQVAPRDSRYGALAMARGGYLPIHREVAMIMQSHAVEWPMPRHGRISRNGHVADLESTFDHGIATNDHADTESGVPAKTDVTIRASEHQCMGLWCLPAYESRQKSGVGGNSSGQSKTIDQRWTPPGQAEESSHGASESAAHRDGAGDTDAPSPPAAPEDCPACCI